MDVTDLVRVEMNDPNRCQGQAGQNQCQFRAEPGQERCKLHMGSVKKLEQKAVYNYRVAQHRASLEHFAGSDQIKSLREEVAVLRMTLESVLSKCRTDTDLIMRSNQISQLVLNIEKLVVSCHRLEERTGFVLDKPTIMHLASQIINVIDQHITDKMLMNTINEQIATLVIETKALDPKTNIGERAF